DSHMIRRVTSYEGALLEEAHPEVHDVLSPEVARTMTAMLEEVIQFGTGIQAKALGRPAAGKTGTTQDYTDAWFVGYTPQLTAGVWVGFDDKQISLGKKETGARAALPIWLEFMQGATAGTPVMDFTNVVPLEEQVGEHHVHVDTPDTAPTEDEPAAPKEKPPAPPPPAKTAGADTAGVSPHLLRLRNNSEQGLSCRSCGRSNWYTPSPHLLGGLPPFSKGIPSSGSELTLPTVLFEQQHVSLAGDFSNRGQTHTLKRLGQELGLLRWHGEQQFVVIPAMQGQLHGVVSVLESQIRGSHLGNL